MRPQFAISALGVVVLAFLMWLKAPFSYWIVAILAIAAIDWSAKRWIFPPQVRSDQPAKFKPDRLMTGAIGAVLGAAGGVAIGIFMQSNASTLQWLAILLGSFGLIFGLVFKVTL
jgi:hypothetical protein